MKALKEWQKKINFVGARKITTENRKQFYNKAGYIQVKNKDGEVLHIGKTTNMGKVYSNYINCERYKQSYNFNLKAGDRLLFKETSLK